MDVKKRYRAIGTAYEQLMKAPPPSAVLKSDIVPQTRDNEEMTDDNFEG